MQFQENQEGLALAYKKYFYELLSYATKMIGDRQEAEDIVNKVFLRVLESWNRFKNPDHLTSPYIYKSVHNACIDFLHKTQKHRARHKEVAYLSEMVWGIAIDENAYNDQLKNIHAAIEALSPRRKEIFNLFYNKGLSTHKIAMQLNLKLQTVSNHKHEAIEAIRQSLKHDIL